MGWDNQLRTTTSGGGVESPTGQVAPQVRHVAVTAGPGAVRTVWKEPQCGHWVSSGSALPYLSKSIGVAEGALPGGAAGPEAGMLGT